MSVNDKDSELGAGNNMINGGHEEKHRGRDGQKLKEKAAEKGREGKERQGGKESESREALAYVCVCLILQRCANI